jgi:Transposase IS200 like
MDFNGEADHVQALMFLPPNLDPSRFVNTLKTTSACLARHKFAPSAQQGLSPAGGLVAVVLHHFVRRRAAGDQAGLEQQETPVSRASARAASPRPSLWLWLKHWRQVG